METYPLFKPIEFADARLFKEAFREDPPEISEFTFTNLYAWREAYRVSVSRMDSFLIVRSDAAKKPEFFIPIGRGDKKAVMLRISEDTGAGFIRVPEKTALLFKNDEHFKIEPDDDNSDYMYRAEDIIKLAGKKYDGKRNLIHKFKRENKYEYMDMNERNVPECLKFEDKWCDVKGCDDVKTLGGEREAVREMAAHFKELDLVGGMTAVNGGISAIAIAEKLNADTLVMHILKADPSITGLYQFMLNEFLTRHAKDTKFVNMEQDLGLENLKKAKLSYHPSHIIKKYTISMLNLK